MDIFSAKFLFLGAIALVVLGPDKLPGALRTVGRLVAEARKISVGLQEQARGGLAQAGLDQPFQELASVGRAIREPIESMRADFVSHAPSLTVSPSAPGEPLSVVTSPATAPATAATATAATATATATATAAATATVPDAPGSGADELVLSWH